jgi:glucose/arabinose dehydrogenase
MTKSRPAIFIFITAIILLIVLLFVSTRNQSPPKETANMPPKSANPSVIAENLEVPWEIVFLPDGNALITERSGRVRLFKNEVLEENSVLSIQDVKAVGEGGLLGMTLHPQFSANHFVYLYYTYSQGGIKNKVVRFTLEEDRLSFNKDVLINIPGSNFHNGGRIKFGPDNLLYVTTGDAENPQLAQNTSSLAGKILRITDEGEIPGDNPFGNEIYSYGHRNPQGLAFDEAGNLWATEHGSSAQDEVNIIQKGGNYGWPDTAGTEEKEGAISPFVQSGSETWAPSGILSWGNYLFFVGLRGQALFRLDKESREITKYFQGEFGRLRTIVLGPDGYFYITTNNKDGRGTPKPQDDKIIRVSLNSLN